MKMPELFRIFIKLTDRVVAQNKAHKKFWSCTVIFLNVVHQFESFLHKFEFRLWFWKLRAGLAVRTEFFKIRRRFALELEFHLTLSGDLLRSDRNFILIRRRVLRKWKLNFINDIVLNFQRRERLFISFFSHLRVICFLRIGLRFFAYTAINWMNWIL